MKTIVAVVAVSSVFLVSGCAQTMRLPEPSDSPYAPVNEPTHGVVKYSEAGLQSIEDAYRNMAYKEAYQACSGDYRIVSEYKDWQWNYIAYECIK